MEQRPSPSPSRSRSPARARYLQQWLTFRSRYTTQHTQKDTNTNTDTYPHTMHIPPRRKTRCSQAVTAAKNTASTASGAHTNKITITHAGTPPSRRLAFSCSCAHGESSCSPPPRTCALCPMFPEKKKKKSHRNPTRSTPQADKQETPPNVLQTRKGGYVERDNVAHDHNEHTIHRSVEICCPPIISVSAGHETNEKSQSPAEYSSITWVSYIHLSNSNW